MKFDYSSKTGRVLAWLYAMIVEHNLINLLRLNFHKISNEAYRSAQPTREQLERYSKKYGIKTIINLKGSNPKGPYAMFQLEKVKELNLDIVHVGIKSRGIPHPEQIAQAKEIFETIQYPVWIHCKAGADRTGIYGNLYQYFRQHIPISQVDQLRFWPYGHIKYSKAGQVDFYFEKFLQYQKEHPEAEFFDWSQNIANKEEMQKEFHSSKFADFINDYILRRQ
jgi:protein tyrosine/serine phosphatase